MWYLTLKPTDDTRMWYYTENGKSFLAHIGVYAEAFDMSNIEKHRQFLKGLFPLMEVEIIECSSRKILTPAMMKTLNLEQVQ